MSVVAGAIIVIGALLFIRWSRRYSIARGRKVIGQGPRMATRDQRSFIWRKYRGHCAHCGKKCFRSRNWHADRGEIDHIKPWSWGGRTTIGNLQLLCGMCNRDKGARFTG